jgi:hypothetical protein
VSFYLDFIVETFYCGCQVPVQSAPFVCYPAFLQEPEPRVIECVKCGATWLANDCPVVGYGQ